MRLSASSSWCCASFSTDGRRFNLLRRRARERRAPSELRVPLSVRGARPPPQRAPRSRFRAPASGALRVRAYARPRAARRGAGETGRAGCSASEGCGLLFCAAGGVETRFAFINRGQPVGERHDHERGIGGALGRKTLPSQTKRFGTPTRDGSNRRRCPRARNPSGSRRRGARSGRSSACPARPRSPRSLRSPSSRRRCSAVVVAQVVGEVATGIPCGRSRTRASRGSRAAVATRRARPRTVQWL